MTKIPWFVSSSSTWFSLEALGVTIDTLCSPYITFGGPNLRLRTYDLTAAALRTSKFKIVELHTGSIRRKKFT